MYTAYCQICGERVENCSNTALGYFCPECAAKYGEQLINAINPVLQIEIQKIKMERAFNPSNRIKEVKRHGTWV